MTIVIYLYNMVHLAACMTDLEKIYRILRVGLKMDSHFKMHSVSGENGIKLSLRGV